MKENTRNFLLWVLLSFCAFIFTVPSTSSAPFKPEIAISQGNAFFFLASLVRKIRYINHTAELSVKTVRESNSIELYFQFGVVFCFSVSCQSTWETLFSLSLPGSAVCESIYNIIIFQIHFSLGPSFERSHHGVHAVANEQLGGSV